MQDSDKRTFYVHGKEFQIYDPDDTVAAETVPGQIYEPAATSLLLALTAEPGVVFFDIGALYGYFACLVKAHNPSCAIHAFEPSTRSFTVLEQNLSVFCDNATPHKVAFSDRKQTASFKGRTFVKGTENERGVEQIETVCYDDWVYENNINATVAKIDVHGAEIKVLRGMTASLQQSIKHALIEVHAPHLIVGGHPYSELIDILEDANFDLFEIEDFRRTSEPNLIPLRDKTRDAFIESKQWTDFQIKNERMLYARRVL